MQGTRRDELSGCFRVGITLCCRSATGGGGACGSAATEHLWGISKGDVAMKPQFSLAGVIDAVQKSLTTLQRQLEAFKSRLSPILAGRQNFNQSGSGGAKSKMSSTSR
jgi:hypothetical protein